MPRLNGRRTTRAPAPSAAADVPSREPSSMTTTSSSGSTARISSITEPTDAASLYAGTMATRRSRERRGSATRASTEVRLSVIGDAPLSLAPPQALIDELLDPGRYGPRPPETPVHQASEAPLGALRGEARGPAVEAGVLRAQPPVGVLVAPAVGAHLRAAVLAVLDGDGVDLTAAPPALERVQPQLPVLELQERLVEPARILEHARAHQRAQADRVAVQEPIRVVRRHPQHALPVAEELHQPVGETEPGIAFERREQGRQRIRAQPVVRVENEQVRRRPAGKP